MAIANKNTKKALTNRGIGGTKGTKVALQQASTLTKDGRDISKNADGLTIKQQGFATNVAIGMTLADAYRNSYDTEDMKLSSIYDAASKLMDRPAVAQRIKAILEDRYHKSLIHNVRHVRQHVFDRLMAESMDPKSPPSARINAVVWLGKVDVVGMFKENIEATVTSPRTSDDIETEIRTRLAALLGGQVIDNTK